MQTLSFSLTTRLINSYFTCSISIYVLMSGAYSGAIGGRLKLKGGVEKKKRRKRRKEQIPDGVPISDEAPTENTGPAEPVDGAGEIMTSGTTVMGSMGTKFKSEVERGDILVIEHPKTQDYESRAVNMVLSDVSLSLSEPFTEDILMRTPYKIQKIPREKPKEVAQGTKTELEEADRTIKYRVKTTTAFGGYVIKSKKLAKGESRSDALRMREKQKSDRYCM